MKQPLHAKGENTPTRKGDLYGHVSNEYDEQYKKELKTNNLDQLKDVDYSREETRAVKEQLDGQAIAKEIGGKKLSSELNDAKDGAGFKDKKDL